MKYKKIFFCLFAASSLLLNACSKHVTPGDYDSTEVGQIKKVVPGVILSKRPVNIHNQAAENSALEITPSTTTATHVDNTVNQSHGYEYVIRLNNGAIISLVQTENLKLETKQHILVIYGKNTRVVADEGNDSY